MTARLEEDVTGPIGKTQFARVRGDTAERNLAIIDEAIIQARQALEDKAKQLALTSKYKSEFLANMSHELRTPLNAIIGYSEMLIEEAEDRGERGFVPDLEKIRASGRHLLHLINDVLDLSKVEAGHMEVASEPVDLDELVRGVANTVRPLVEQRLNRLELCCPPRLGRVETDGVKLRQILRNLLSNAAKFTENGAVTFEAELDREGERGRLRLRVADTGVGMKQAQLAGLRIGRTLQGLGLFDRMPVLENVMVGADRHARAGFFSSLLALPRSAKDERALRERAMAVLVELGIAEYAGRLPTSLPYAIRKRVALARALVSEPELLLLDEPASGLSNDEMAELGEVIRGLTEQMSVMLVEHHMDLVMSVCDHIVVLDFGKVIARGGPDQVREDPAVLAAYLGDAVGE